MKKPFSFLFACFLILLGAPAYSLHAQANSNTGIYAVFEYMKVKPGMYNEYIRVEHDLWKPMQEMRIKDGEILGWYIYECRFPSGSEKPYDYITVTLYNDFSKLEAPFENLKALIAKVHPDKKAAQVNQQTLASRDLVYGEVFNLLDQTIPGQEGNQARFMAVNFMKAKVGKGSEYVEMEQQYWKNYHQIRIDDQAMNVWMLWGRVLPDGTSVEYDFMTIDGFDNFSDMTIDQPEWAQRIKPQLPTGNTFSDIADKTVGARDLVRRELWQLINYANGESSVATSGN